MFFLNNYYLFFLKNKIYYKNKVKILNRNLKIKNMKIVRNFNYILNGFYIF